MKGFHMPNFFRSFHITIAIAFWHAGPTSNVAKIFRFLQFPWAANEDSKLKILKFYYHPKSVLQHLVRSSLTWCENTENKDSGPKMKEHHVTSLRSQTTKTYIFEKQAENYLWKWNKILIFSQRRKLKGGSIRPPHTHKLY